MTVDEMIACLERVKQHNGGETKIYIQEKDLGKFDIDTITVTHNKDIYPKEFTTSTEVIISRSWFKNGDYDG